MNQSKSYNCSWQLLLSDIVYIYKTTTHWWNTLHSSLDRIWFTIMVMVKKAHLFLSLTFIQMTLVFSSFPSNLEAKLKLSLQGMFSVLNIIHSSVYTPRFCKYDVWVYVVCICQLLVGPVKVGFLKRSSLNILCS